MNIKTQRSSLLCLLGLWLALNLRAQPVCNVRVFTDDGRPLSKAEISLFNIIGKQVASSQTDDLGFVTITLNKGSYLISASKEGYLTKMSTLTQLGKFSVDGKNIIINLVPKMLSKSEIAVNLEDMYNVLPDTWASPAFEEKITLVDRSLKHLNSSDVSLLLLEYKNLISAYNEVFLNSLKEMPLEFPLGFFSSPLS